MDKILAALEKRGAEISRPYETEETNIPAGRVEVRRDIDQISTIFIPLTPDEWCSLCMAEGEHYIGPCCAQSGHTQDILNSIFRDSGWVDVDTAESMVQVGGSHDGHELLREQDEKVLLEAEAGWDDLGPLRKVFLCIAAARPKMKPRSQGRVSDPDDTEDIVFTLSKCSGYLSINDLFARNPENKTKQHEGNRAVRVARMVPAAKAFLSRASEIGCVPFEGFAIADPNGKLGENMMGYALFEKKKEAEKVLESWQKDEDSKDSIAAFSIRKVRITIEKGIEFIVG